MGDSNVHATYETVYILESGLSDTDVKSVDSKMDAVVEKMGGSLIVRDDWGVCELAYPIGKAKSGRYVVGVYAGPAGVVEEIERHFKISSHVIRFLTVKSPKNYDYSVVRRQTHGFDEDRKRERAARGARRSFSAA